MHTCAARKIHPAAQPGKRRTVQYKRPKVKYCHGPNLHVLRLFFQVPYNMHEVAQNCVQNVQILLATGAPPQTPQLTRFPRPRSWLGTGKSCPHNPLPLRLLFGVSTIAPSVLHFILVPVVTIQPTIYNDLQLLLGACDSEHDCAVGLFVTCQWRKSPFVICFEINCGLLFTLRTLPL